MAKPQIIPCRPAKSWSYCRAFRRNQRGKTQSQLAAEIGVSQNFLSDLERGKATGDMMLYGKLARCLRLRIVDLAPDGD